MDSNVHNKSLILRLSLGVRLLSGILVYLGSSFPAFDTSHSALSTFADAVTSVSLRWDSFHFTSVAQNGYTFEYQYAFLPGTPLAMRAGTEIARWVGLMKWSDQPSAQQLLLSGLAVSIMLDPSRSLYE